MNVTEIRLKHAYNNLIKAANKYNERRSDFEFMVIEKI